MKTCRECKFGVFQDYGYSNWTVEGTTFDCAVDLHPEHKSLEVTFNDDRNLQYAESCQFFQKGDSIDLDVDQERKAEWSEEQKFIWKGFNKEVTPLEIFTLIVANENPTRNP